jgi:hypothetical protein
MTQRSLKSTKRERQLQRALELAVNLLIDEQRQKKGMREIPLTIQTLAATAINLDDDFCNEHISTQLLNYQARYEERTEPADIAYGIYDHTNFAEGY